MKVTVLGVKNVKGVSRKTGKAFDNTVVNVGYPASGVVGSEVETVWLDKTKYPLEEIKVGKVYDLNYNHRGFVSDFVQA